ncbi:hypothetical protein F5X97DRAFT_310554 [Nemania serpens]|nr:hypothetical protein F5X97DRAFT_310554 [Nemania serpens]
MSETSSGVQHGNSMSGWSGVHANRNRTLVASNLQRLPTWEPLSDWLIRGDDPFPYGTHRAASNLHT